MPFELSYSVHCLQVAFVIKIYADIFHGGVFFRREGLSGVFSVGRKFLGRITLNSFHLSFFLFGCVILHLEGMLRWNCPVKIFSWYQVVLKVFPVGSVVNLRLNGLSFSLGQFS